MANPKYRQEKVEQEAFEYLMALPVSNPGRINLRDRYAKFSNEQLASKTRAWLTLSAEYAARNSFRKMLSGPLPSCVYPAWTYRKTDDPRVKSSWPSYRAQQIAAILAAEGPQGLIGLDGVGEVIEITDVRPLRIAA